MKYLFIVQDFHPDVVIVMHAINDIQEGALEPTKLPWKRPYERDYGHNASGLFRQVGEESGLGRPQGPLWRELRVLAGLADGLEQTLFSDFRPAGPRTWAERQRLADLENLPSLPSFRRNLRTLGQLVRAQGGRLLICSQPSMFRPGGITGERGYLLPDDQRLWEQWQNREHLYHAVYVRAFRRFNDAARSVADETGAAFVDLEAAVPPRWECFLPENFDPVHMGAQGCILTAKALHDTVLPLIPEHPPTSGPAQTRPTTGGAP